MSEGNRLRPGRQLFVDDALIERTTLTRRFHRPHLDRRSPVMKPETAVERNGGVMPAAAMANVAWDERDGLFKNWYLGGYDDGFCLATSIDGVRWERPLLDVVFGTNRVLPGKPGYVRNGCTVLIDRDASDPAERYKMLAFYRAGTGSWPRKLPDPLPDPEEVAFVYTSADGVHWNERARTGPCGDNTSFFFNPFRGTWSYSIRTFGGARGRIRSFCEHPAFVAGAGWSAGDVKDWLAADRLDRSDPALQWRPELYKVDCVAYESLLLGVFGLYLGPPNHVAGDLGVPKIIDLELGYSRDGFDWIRPDREAFLACSRQPGTWNRGYLQASGGVCLVIGDELWFYFSAFSGISPVQGGGPYAGGALGLAKLRRDGFASMDGPGLPMPAVTHTGAREKGAKEAPHGGELVTRVFELSGQRLFVNANVKAGELRVAITDPAGREIEPWTLDRCIGITGDSTRHAVAWRDAGDLDLPCGRPVRLHFALGAGELYSFWISPDASGASHGYVAAGGPGFTGATDTTGA